MLSTQLNAIANDPVITFQKQDAARVNAVCVAAMAAGNEREPRVFLPRESLAVRDRLPGKWEAVLEVAF